MCKILANMTQVSDVAPGPLVNWDVLFVGFSEELTRGKRGGVNQTAWREFQPYFRGTYSQRRRETEKVDRWRERERERMK
jgi:hypothetical protein